MTRTAAATRAWGSVAGAVVLVFVAFVAPAATAAQEVPAASSSAQLDARATDLAAELAGIAADATLSDGAIVDARQRVDDATGALAAAEVEQVRVRSVLTRYSVGAYLGNDVTDALAVDTLTDQDGDLAGAGGHVLTTTAHGELVGRVRASQQDLDTRRARLDAARATLDGEVQHRQELEQRSTAVSAELTVTRSAAARALAEERRRAEEDARRRAEDEALARTPRPTSARTGVIPPASVRADIIARLTGTISPTALDAYWRAAKMANERSPGCGIDWALVGAIGRVESNHATYGGTTLHPDGSTDPVILGPRLDGGGFARLRDTDGGALDGDPVLDRAVGPMQFIPSTWHAFESDGNGDGVADPHNLFDAALAAGRYLCAAGGGPLGVIEHASRAVYAYNRDAVYNAEVLTMADEYRRTIDPTLPPATPPPAVPVDPTNLPPPATPGVPPPATPANTTTTAKPVTTTTTTPPTTAPGADGAISGTRG